MTEDATDVQPGANDARGPRRPLVVAADGALSITAGATGERAGAGEIRVHLHTVRQIRDVGILLAGSVEDPDLALDRADVEAGERVSLADFAVGVDRRGVSGLRSYEIVGFVPGDVRADCRIHLATRDGATLTGRLFETGDGSGLDRALARAPLADSFALLARVIPPFLDRAGGGPAMPPELQALLESTEGLLRARSHDGSAGGKPIEVFIDDAFRTGRAGFVVKGWAIRLPDDPLTAVTAVSLFGRRVPVPLPLPSVFRQDVVDALASKVPGGIVDCGFLAYVPAPAGPAEEQFWFLEFETASGSIRRAPFRLGNEKTARVAIETTIGWTQDPAPDLVALFEGAVGPALKALWRTAREQSPAGVETRFGEPVAAPRVSVVVPLYGRIDFLRHQIASLSNDPDFRRGTGEVDLVYVLDDPRASKDLAFMADLVHRTYGIPFRVIDLKGNHGYSTANNAGVAAARGDVVVLLNSDVIPKRAGWISALRTTFESLEDCGILGCRLLLEDGSIQHAGMAFQETPMLRGSWANVHLAKGLATTFDPCPGTMEVPAVTGACLMIPRALYEEVGGLSTDYIIGDFEDSDLCLKVRQRGLKVFYTPTVELYHLERQSMSLVGNGGAGWRQQLTLYNMWQHAERWRSVIAPIAIERG